MHSNTPRDAFPIGLALACLLVAQLGCSGAYTTDDPDAPAAQGPSGSGGKDTRAAGGDDTLEPDPGVPGVPASGETGGAVPAPGEQVAVSAACKGFPFKRVVPVSDASQLAYAVSTALPGDLIQLADGAYVGRFVIRAKGTEADGIVVCGSRDAVLDGGNHDVGTITVKLDGASHVTLAGVRILRSERALIVERSSNNKFIGLELSDVRTEAMIFRAFSSNNVVERCSVHDTGRMDPARGAGIHVGTWWGETGWGRYSGGQPDRSDNNTVRDCTIGPNVTAESIEVWAGTTGTKVIGNTFDGKGMSGLEAGDSWLNITGNNGTYEGNKGTRTFRNGFEVREGVTGWGRNNVFRGNTASIDATNGVAFFLQDSGLGTKVYCSNHTMTALRNITTPIDGATGVSLSNQPCFTGL